MAYQPLLERGFAASYEDRGPHVLDKECQRCDRGDVVAGNEGLVVDHGDLETKAHAHAREELEADPRARRSRSVNGVDARRAGGGKERAHEQKRLVVAPPCECAV